MYDVENAIEFIELGLTLMLFEVSRNSNAIDMIQKLLWFEIGVLRTQNQQFCKNRNRLINEPTFNYSDWIASRTFIRSFIQ